MSTARWCVAAVAVIQLSPAIAAECGDGKTVFSCLTGNGKVIGVCDFGKTISYSFGKANATPEIVVRVPRSDASTFQWYGVGRWMSYSVDIPNGDTTYSVFWGVDKLGTDFPIEAGVNVVVKEELVATVRCVGDKHIEQNIEGIDLPESH